MMHFRDVYIKIYKTEQIMILKKMPDDLKLLLPGKFQDVARNRLPGLVFAS